MGNDRSFVTNHTFLTFGCLPTWINFFSSCMWRSKCVLQSH